MWWMTILISIGLPLLALILTTIVFYRISKDRKPFKLGLTFGGIHLLIAVFMGISVYFMQKSDGEAIMGWMWLSFIDFPLFMILPILERCWTPLSAIGYSNYASSIYIGTLGSLQYFLIGTGIGWVCNKLSKRI